MKVAIASGKGGVGKTTVAANLAYIASRYSSAPVCLLDCDVEEPNCHIFVKPILDQKLPVYVNCPSYDPSLCTQCGQCADICQFQAIVYVGKNILVFPDLCHGCGGCWRGCPEKAITKGQRTVGDIERGWADGFAFVQGKLNIGEPSAVPVIRTVKSYADDNSFVIVDCPPGCSCPTIEAVRDCDFVILVCEPTPFGVHDLHLIVELLRLLEVPFGVVINRDGIGDSCAHDYCAREAIPIIASVPDDRIAAEACSRGELIVKSVPSVQKPMVEIYFSVASSLVGSESRP
ncbi:MAG: ATP-binding protein [Candidatus Hinthialibacter antarcticus]|nr:ATP-binding protein [Candidatus Hinthialibacter antarcticus]